MRRVDLLKTLMMAGAVAALGCSAAPKQRPRILSSRSPVGAPQAPPLNSTSPIAVPSAPVARPTPVQVVPVPQAVVPPSGVVVQQPGAVLQPAPGGTGPQANYGALPQQPGNVPARPQGSTGSTNGQFHGSPGDPQGTQPRDGRGDNDPYAPRPLVAPPPQTPSY